MKACERLIGNNRKYMTDKSNIISRAMRPLPLPRSAERSAKRWYLKDPGSAGFHFYCMEVSNSAGRLLTSLHAPLLKRLPAGEVLTVLKAFGPIFN